MSKDSELLYESPVLIYDNFCTSCTRFAHLSRILSRDRIYVVGHYTNEGKQIKNKIFPKDFDANKMFWMVTSKGAFGARSGLSTLVFEVLKGMFGIGESVTLVKHEEIEEQELLCSIDSMGCSSMPGFFSRLSGLFKNSKKIERTP